jgi:drug/metabolite transporter (DMT)-like permease
LAPIGARDATGATTLLAYAVPFSFAYVRIGAAVGALVLFGAVQLTMIGYGLSRGERPRPLTWAGLGLASAGLVALMLPAAVRPDSIGTALMACAGVAWGAYSLAGRVGGSPIATNARSFLWSSPVAIVVMMLFGTPAATTPRGLVLAIACGAVTSGLGYALWYRALPRLSVTQASVAQLGVPVIAALGGALLLAEPITMRFIIAGAAVLGGVALALLTRSGSR